MRPAPADAEQSSGGHLTEPAPRLRDGAELVYFITHAKLGAARVGIERHGPVGLAQHRRKGGRSWRSPGECQVCAAIEKTS